VAKGCKFEVKNSMSNRHFHVTYLAFIGHPSLYYRLYITHPLCHHVACNLLPISTSVYQLPRCCCSISIQEATSQPAFWKFTVYFTGKKPTI